MIYLIKISLFQISISYLLIYFAKMYNLNDIPDKRKIHKKPIPYVGGLILSLTFVFSVFVTDYHDEYINLILNFSLLIALVGFLDDKYKLNPGTKLILQSLPIFMLINQNIFLTDIGNYSLLGTIKLGSFSKIFTFLCCLLLINAFNYSDGIDGLISILTIHFLLSISYFIYIFDKNNFTTYHLLISFTLIIFLFFNFGLTKNVKIFLGDSGSNLLGFVVSFLSIVSYKHYNVHPAVIIWTLAYIIFEFLFVNINRLILNHKLFKPGKDHLHYELKKILKINYIYVCLIILFLNIFFTITGYVIYLKFNADLSLFIFAISFLIYFFVRRRFILK